MKKEKYIYQSTIIRLFLVFFIKMDKIIVLFFFFITEEILHIAVIISFFFTFLCLIKNLDKKPDTDV